MSRLSTKCLPFVDQMIKNLRKLSSVFKKNRIEIPFSMQILNNNKQFSTLSDLSTAVLRHNLKIRAEKKQIEPYTRFSPAKKGYFKKK